MSPPDDYEEDMRRLSRFSDRELDGILAGRVPADGDELEDLVQHLQALRAVQVAAPGPEVESHHLALVAEAVSSLRGEHLPAEIDGVSESTGWRSVMTRTRALTLKLGLGSLAALLSIGGLAYAGVELPGTAAEKAFEAVTGVELPNQAGGDEAALPTTQETGNDVSEAASDHSARKGCEFGQAIAALASEKSFEVRQDEGNDAAPCAAHSTEAHGSRGTGEEHSAAGAENAVEGKAHAEEGKAKGAEASETAGGNGNSAEHTTDPAGGPETGDSSSADAKDKGLSHRVDAGSLSNDHAQTGLDNKPTDLP